MTPYVGSGAYCYANSLHMSLLGSGIQPERVPSPGFLECLTTMPFGNTYLAGPQLFFFDGLDPDRGLTRALETLGVTCHLERDGDEETALGRLREAVQHGPVLLGPLDMGYLTYQPNHRQLGGSDHFVVALDVEDDHVVVHDPNGFPFATLPLDLLLQAWRAERIEYTSHSYTLRADFHLTERASRQAMIEKTLPLARSNLQHDPAGPAVFGGVRALRLLARPLSAEIPQHLGAHLVYFALPLAVRRKLDAAAFLREGDQLAAADLIDEQARLLGRAQYPAVQQDWASVAALVEQIAEQEERLLAVTASW